MKNIKQIKKNRRERLDLYQKVPLLSLTGANSPETRFLICLENLQESNNRFLYRKRKDLSPSFDDFHSFR